MNKLLLAVLCAWCTSASATVLTFDNLDGNLGAIPDGYGGFLWNVDTSVGVANGLQQSANDPTAPGYANGIVTSPNVAFNFSGGSPTTIARQAGDLITFNDAYFTSTSGVQQLSFRGFAGGVLLFTSASYTITAAGPLQITLDWSGIDSLEIDSVSLDDTTPPWVLDNFEFNADGTGGDTGGGGDTGSGTPMPEPLSLSLMGLGLAALGAVRRKRA